MFIRSWCPDRTLHQARKYIADTMGERYAEGVILNLEATWEESNPQVPLICFLSMGSDPTGAIENLAKRKGIGMFENQLAPQKYKGLVFHFDCTEAALFFKLYMYYHTLGIQSWRLRIVLVEAFISFHLFEPQHLNVGQTLPLSHTGTRPKQCLSKRNANSVVSQLRFKIKGEATIETYDLQSESMFLKCRKDPRMSKRLCFVQFCNLRG